MREYGHRGDCEHRRGTESEHDGSLGDLLDRCGHYFAHRVGGSRRGQGQVLALLAQRSGLSQKELSEALGVIPASLSEVLAKLERKGLIRRERDENDHRLLRVHLTPEGEAAAGEQETPPGDPFQVLTPEEQETMSRLLSKLMADWKTRYTTEQKRQGERCSGEKSGQSRKHSGRKKASSTRSNEPGCHLEEGTNSCL